MNQSSAVNKIKVIIMNNFMNIDFSINDIQSKNEALPRNNISSALVGFKKNNIIKVSTDNKEKLHYKVIDKDKIRPYVSVSEMAARDVHSYFKKSDLWCRDEFFEKMVGIKIDKNKGLTNLLQYLSRNKIIIRVGMAGKNMGVYKLYEEGDEPVTERKDVPDYNPSIADKAINSFIYGNLI